MARAWFGQTAADWALQVGAGSAAILRSGVALTGWNDPTSGTQYTDLLDTSGNPITQVTTGDGTVYPVGIIPRFRGPDGVLEMWLDGGAGFRFLVASTDLASLVGGKIDRAGDSMDGPLTLQDNSLAASQDYVLARVGGAPSIQTFSLTGIASVRTGANRVYNDTGRPLALGTVRVSAATGPAGQALILDVHKDGTTIYSTQGNRPQIAAGQVTGTGGTPDVATWAMGEYLTVDIDQVGTTTPGSDLTVTIPAS